MIRLDIPLPNDLFIPAILNGAGGLVPARMHGNLYPGR